MESVRLNQYLARAGVCSRREADRLIAEGRVTVDGETAQMGQRVTEDNVILCDGVPVRPETEQIILAVNKPVGIVCTTAHFKGEKNIVDMIDYGKRIYPVGRLDKASEGLILMTNDGDLAEAISRGSNMHEKEYIVRVDRPVTAEFLERMRSGVEILGRRTRPCKVKKLAADSFSIILTQGMNRQIRRMCEALDYRVRALKRIRVMNIELGDLPAGSWRELTAGEKAELIKEAGK